MDGESTGGGSVAAGPAPRLPKTIEADPRASRLSEHLLRRARPLWSGAVFHAASLAPGEAVKAALLSANQAGFVVRGLEAAERRLAEEERGLALAAQPDRNAAVRISRLLLVTNDGSERFYRNVEGLLRRHGPRLHAIRLEIDEHDLGELLYGPDRVTRLVLLEHKNAVAALLLAVAGQWQNEEAPA
ncbi:MAG: hypothetical protein ABR538_13175 [Candidatus Binatia bacterium]